MPFIQEIMFVLSEKEIIIIVLSSQNCVIVKAVKICVLLQLHSQHSLPILSIQKVSKKTSILTILLLFQSGSWEDKHFFSLILDKVFAVTNKQNQLKI